MEGVRDIERLMGRVSVGRAHPKDVVQLAQSLSRVPKVQALLCDASHALGRKWKQMDCVQDLSSLLLNALREDAPVASHEGGIFQKGYHAVLDSWIALCEEGQGFLLALEKREKERTGIASLKVRYNRVFGYYLEVTKANLGQVPADYMRKQTLVGAERFITPELKDYEEKVLHADEKRKVLEQELFVQLLDVVNKASARVRAVARAVAETDVLASMAEVADVHRYVRPQLCEGHVLHLHEARHPVLERLMPQGERFVPNDVLLSSDDRQLLLVTGPNMAGKSTVMRQVALCTLMAHMGSFVPAKQARIGLCDRIFTRVGASDNLGKGQSTFMVEMLETATILKEATAQSVVLLDEIGRGTSTYDGLSIAWAVAEDVHDRIRCRTMFATHYHELTQLAASRPRIKNVHVAVSEEQGKIVFLRALAEGPANRSYGIAVATLAGVPNSVIQRAQVLLADLEQQSSVARKQPTHSKKQGPRVVPAQLSLF
jgi:DNA mismatch repair protein MutS